MPESVLQSKQEFKVGEEYLAINLTMYFPGLKFDSHIVEIINLFYSSNFVRVFLRSSHSSYEFNIFKYDLISLKDIPSLENWE